MDSNLSILTLFPRSFAAPYKTQTPSPSSVIVRIDKIESNVRDAGRVIPVIGFVYVLGDGTQYYNPRPQGVLTKREIEASRTFMKAANAPRYATNSALDWALHSNGTASVRIEPTLKSYGAANVTRHGCVEWPKGKLKP